MTCRTAALLVAIAEMAMPRASAPASAWRACRTRSAFWFGEDQARYVIAAPFAEAEKIVEEARAAFITVAELGKTGGDTITLDDKDSVDDCRPEGRLRKLVPQFHGRRRNPGNQLGASWA